MDPERAASFTRMLELSWELQATYTRQAAAAANEAARITDQLAAVSEVAARWDRLDLRAMEADRLAIAKELSRRLEADEVSRIGRLVANALANMSLLDATAAAVGTVSVEGHAAGVVSPSPAKLAAEAQSRPSGLELTNTGLSVLVVLLMIMQFFLSRPTVIVENETGGPAATPPAVVHEMSKAEVDQLLSRFAHQLEVLEEHDEGVSKASPTEP